MLRQMLEMYVWLTLAYPPAYIKFVLEVTGMRFWTWVAVYAMVEVEMIADTHHLP